MSIKEKYKMSDYAISYLVGEGASFEFDETEMLVHDRKLDKESLCCYLAAWWLYNGHKTLTEIENAFDDCRITLETFPLPEACVDIERLFICIIDYQVPVAEFIRVPLYPCKTEKEAEKFVMDHLSDTYGLKAVDDENWWIEEHKTSLRKTK